MSSPKWRPFCLGVDELKNEWQDEYLDHNMFQSNQPGIGTFLHPRHSREDTPGCRGAFDRLIPGIGNNWFAAGRNEGRGLLDFLYEFGILHHTC